MLALSWPAYYALELTPRCNTHPRRCRRRAGRLYWRTSVLKQSSFA